MQRVTYTQHDKHMHDKGAFGSRGLEKKSFYAKAIWCGWGCGASIAKNCYEKNTHTHIQIYICICVMCIHILLRTSCNNRLLYNKWIYADQLLFLCRVCRVCILCIQLCTILTVVLCNTPRVEQQSLDFIDGQLQFDTFIYERTLMMCGVLRD